jgi:hypothetical protein
MYALAAEKLFAGDGRVTEGSLYFYTSTGGFVEQTVPVNADSNASRTGFRTIADNVPMIADSG